MTWVSVVATIIALLAFALTAAGLRVLAAVVEDLHGIKHSLLVCPAMTIEGPCLKPLTVASFAEGRRARDGMLVEAVLQCESHGQWDVVMMAPPIPEKVLDAMPRG